MYWYTLSQHGIVHWCQEVPREDASDVIVFMLLFSWAQDNSMLGICHSFSLLITVIVLSLHALHSQTSRGMFCLKCQSNISSTYSKKKEVISEKKAIIIGCFFFGGGGVHRCYSYFECLESCTFYWAICSQMAWNWCIQCDWNYSVDGLYKKVRRKMWKMNGVNAPTPTATHAYFSSPPSPPTDCLKTFYRQSANPNHFYL